MSACVAVPFVDLRRQHEALGDELRDAIERVIASSGFVGGEEVRRFEAEFAEYCGVRHCVGVGNGTDALALALRALGVGPGDAVLTVPFTFVASVEAIDLVGGRPVFADIDAADYAMAAGAAEAVMVRERIRAILVVHLYGQPADMERLSALAARYGVPVVEDAAQAHGARARIAGRWRRAGGLGAIGCFSFYPTKNLGGVGDGGAVTTDDGELADRVRLLRDHGQVRKYEHAMRGATNSRLDAVQAAVLRVKLRRLEEWNAARRRAAAWYTRHLRGLPLVLPVEPEGRESVFHQYVVRVAERDQVRRRLEKGGIGTGVHYPLPVHLQPGYDSLGYREGDFPVAELCAREVLSLPLYTGIGEAEQESVAAALRWAVSDPACGFH